MRSPSISLAGLGDDDIPIVNRGDALEPYHSGSGAGALDPWGVPDLTLLGTGRRVAPSFPLDLLGEFWADYTARAAAGASAPPDYVGASLLACVGSMLANVRWPLAGSGWAEPPVLWIGPVGQPSAGKSPAMDAAFDLVREAEDRMADGFDHIAREHEAKKQAAKALNEDWAGRVKAAVKAGEPPPAMPLEAVEPEAPVRPRVRVADATSEKLGVLAAALPRGLLMVRDELSGWLGAFDRYSGSGSDRAFALESYGGRSYVVDRMRNAEPLRIRHLSIGALGGIQPDRLRDLLDGPDDGLVSRVLWSWPDALPQFRLPREALDDRAARAAFTRLADLAMGSDDNGTSTPKRLRLSRDAEDTLEGFAQEVADKANEASGLYAGALGKARGHVLRLSAIFEHLWWCASPGSGEPTIISENAVGAAAAIVDGYFIPMAERAFGDAAIPSDERAAMHLTRYLKATGQTRFNARETRREIGGDLRDGAKMDAACAALCEANIIRPIEKKAEGAGRKPKNFEVNTIIFNGRPR